MIEVADYPGDYLGDVMKIIDASAKVYPCRCGECDECMNAMLADEMQVSHDRTMGYI